MRCLKTSHYQRSKKLPIIALLLMSPFLLFIQFDANARDLVVGIDSTVERLVPITLKNPETFPVSMQIYEGLFDVDEQGNVIPRIIEKWETKDYKTWIFHVRRGVYFHRSEIFKNGTREVTAHDVLYSLTRFCSPESYSSFLVIDYLEGAREYNQRSADKVKGLRVIDSHTLEVSLIKAVPFFINHISTPVLSVFPQEMERKEYSNRAGLKIAVGTGPYIFKSMTDTEVVLDKNEVYWDKDNAPTINRVIFRVIKNDQARLAALRRGKVDLLILPNSLFPSVLDGNGELKSRFRNNYRIKSVATFNSHFIGINNRVISDPDLRRAMFWATDRSQIVNSILYGYADVAPGTVPPGLNGYKHPFAHSTFDLAKAREYLVKSSYKGEPIELLVHELANSEQVGQIFQSQMAKVGINIALQKMDYGSLIGRMINGDVALFSMFMEYAFSSPEPILINIFSTTKIPVPNFFRFSNASVDVLIDDLYKIRNKKESLILCSKIEKKIMEDVPAVFLYRQQYVILHSKDITGLEISGNNHYFLEKVRFVK